MRGFFLVASAVIGGLTATPASAQYSVIDLGTLPIGYDQEFAAGINSSGQVVGQVTSAAFVNRATRWTLGTGYETLGTLGGATNDSFGLGINDSGVVVGSSETGVGINTRPFIHEPGGSMQSLGTLGGEFGTARAINASGVVTGFASNGSTLRAFIWTEVGGMDDIGNFTPAGSSAGNAINSAGHVAGSGTTMAGDQHAFFWNGTDPMVDLGTIGTGTQSQALGMNDSDVVVGYGAQSPSGSTYGAFVWTSGVGISQLSQLFSYDTRARDVNNAGDIVGSSWIDGMGNSRAVIWKGGGAVVNLNTYINPASGWLLTNATGINDAGQIVGMGTLNGTSRAFLLTPVPEPASYPLIAGAAVTSAIAGRGLRRRLMALG
jgi:probable HAF family extracellular repeat protein